MNELPEFEASRLARERAAQAVTGELTLQRCPDCGKIQYPFRELCEHCLSDGLYWSRVERNGMVIEAVRVHASMHPFFRDHAPWEICSVALDAGPRVIAHCRDAGIESGVQVVVSDEHVGPAHCVLVARIRA
ncbi:MAG: zinc ribbon domain-containing protein [Woeseia sp.]